MTEDSKLDARRDAVDNSMPRAKRVGTSVFNEVIVNLESHHLNTLMLLDGPRFCVQNTGCGLDLAGLSSSIDLWIAISAAHGVCDAVVEHLLWTAKVFAFETASLYVYCHAQSGHNGTAWFMAEKAATQKKSQSGGLHERHVLGSTALAEILNFFEELGLDMSMAHDPTWKALSKSMPIVMALAEAQELRGATTPPVVGQALARRAGL